MLKLSLPAYDAERPLTIRLVGRSRVAPNGDPFSGGQAYAPFSIELYPDAWIGDVRVALDEAAFATPAGSGWFDFDVSHSIDVPAALGLHGGEGWFRLWSEKWVLITDCQVSYTPSGPGDGTTAQGFFS
jgi:hypothetical protein